MPRNPHVRTLAVCSSSFQAELIADSLTKNVESVEQEFLFGEVPQVIRVIPVGGQWLVRSYDRDSLTWDQADLDDNPLDTSEASVSFP